MATNIEVYTEGGAPSNGQVASVKVATVDFSKLNDGAGLAIADVVDLFDLDKSEQVITGGYEVLDKTSATMTMDIGLAGGSTFVNDLDGTSVVVPTVIAAVPALNASGKVTILINTAVATAGRVKVWLVVARFIDPAEPVPASVRTPPVTP
jgi:hypothetical protein